MKNENSSQQKITQIRTAISKSLHIQHIKIEDESAHHKNHPEAIRTGKGHFAVVVVSDDFIGKPRPIRHRMIYNALEKEINSFIHALSIKAYTPDEWQQLSEH